MSLRRSTALRRLFVVILAAIAACIADEGWSVAPVLVITDSQQTSNPFGEYYTEILRGEGLMAFDRVDHAAWMNNSEPAALLSSYSAVILSEMSLSASESQLLWAYVQNGGALIAARPDTELSDVFGIQATGSRAEQVLQYYGIDGAASVGRGLANGAMQYHGGAANYSLQGATPLAYLYDSADTQSANPAITTNDYGQGRAIAFAFDPAKSVVLSRQGNPEWQNSEGDGIPASL